MAGQMETIGLRAVLEGASGYLSNLNKIEKAEKDLADQGEKTADKQKKMGEALTKMSLVGVTAFAGLGALAVKFAMDFENQMSQVGAVLQANDEEMKGLAKTAKQLGADTAFSAGDAAKAMHELAAGGRSVAQIMGGEAKAAVDLAAAGNYDLAQSAKTIATTMDIWKDSQLETNDVVNRLAGAANTSRFGVEDMSAAIAQGGGVAAQAGVSFQDFSTVIAATASSFASGSDAGTSFKTFVIGLTGNSEKAKDMIKQLGLEFYDAQGNMKPMSDIVQQLHDKLGPLSAELQTTALKTIFGNDAFRTAAGLMKLTGAEFTTMSDKMRDTKASDVAAQRMDNLAGSLEQLKGSMETLAIQTGERVIPVLGFLAKGATELANGFGAMPAASQNMMLAFAGIAVGMPALISTISKAASMVSGLGTAMGTWHGQATAAALGIGLIAIAADAILKKTSGHGLIEWIFGDPRKVEATTAAMKAAQAAFEAYTTPVEKLAAAVRSAEQATADFNKVTGGMDADVARILAERNTEIGQSAEALEIKIRGLTQAFLAQNPTLNEMQTLAAAIPSHLQHLITGTDQWKTALATADEVAKAHNRTEEEAIDLLKAERGAREEVRVEVETIQTPLEAWIEGLEAEEEATGKAVDRAKDFVEVLDTLAGRFSTFNPAVTVAQGKLAAIDEELADLARSGGTYSDVLGKTVGQLKDEKKALEDLIEAAGENEKSTKGMRDELQLYIGEGLLNVQSAIQETIKGHESQITAEQNVAKALRALSNDDIPGFLKALDKVNVASPETAKAVISALGPELNTKLRANIPTLEASGSAIGASIAEGLLRGLDSASNRISEKSFEIGQNSVAAMARGAETKSPSKATYRIGKDIAYGLEYGIADGMGSLIPDVQRHMRDVMGVMADTWDAGIQGFGRHTADDLNVFGNILKEAVVKGKEMTGHELLAMFDYANNLINGDFGGVVKTPLLKQWDHAFAELRVQFEKDGNVNSAALTKLFEQMRDAALKHGPTLDQDIRAYNERVNSGIRAGVPALVQSAQYSIDGIINAMKRGLTEGADSLGADKGELADLLQGMSDIITNSPMPDAARKLAQDTITGWAIGIGAGQGLANQSVIEFMEKLRNTISTAGAAMLNPTAGGASFVLGSDGKWYKDEAAMPKGVTGASTITSQMGTYDKSITYEQEQKQLADAIWAWHHSPMFGFIDQSGGWKDTQSTPLGSAVGTAQGAKPGFQGAAAPSSSITVDLRGANLTGTLEENETMIHRVVTSVLRDVSGRDAFVSGVKV